VRTETAVSEIKHSSQDREICRIRRPDRPHRVKVCQTTASPDSEATAAVMVVSVQAAAAAASTVALTPAVHGLPAVSEDNL